MRHFTGWTMVVAVLTAAAFMWFLHTIAPDVNAWLKEQQHLSGWAQAVGAVIAIWGAYELGKMQAVAARKLVREQQFADHLRFLQSIRKLLEHTDRLLRTFREGWQLHGDLRQRINETMRMRQKIENIDITKCESPDVVQHLLYLPDLLIEMIAHQQRVNDNYTAAIVADRDSPGKRTQTFVAEMEKTADAEHFIRMTIGLIEEEEKEVNQQRQHL